MSAPGPSNRPGASDRPGAPLEAGGDEPGTTASPPDIAGLLERTPRTHALRPDRRPGLRGWRWWQIAAGVAVAASFFAAYGGATAPDWVRTPLVVLAAGLSGFVVASYLPRGGVPKESGICALFPLAATLMVPAVLAPGQLVGLLLGVPLLAALAAQRTTGAGCA